MPRGLIGMTCCGGVVFRARTRCGHVSSELEMLLAATWAKENFSPSELESGRLGNYSRAENRIGLDRLCLLAQMRDQLVERVPCPGSWRREGLEGIRKILTVRAVYRR